MRTRIAALLAGALTLGLASIVAPAQAAPEVAASPAVVKVPRGYPSSLPAGCDKKSSRGNSHLVVCFQKYGDKIWVYDGAKDGRSAVGVWKGVDFSRSGRCINSLGFGHWKVCNYDFPEDHAIGISGYTQNEGNGHEYDVILSAGYVSTS